jgi:hypothetical protein
MRFAPGDSRRLKLDPSKVRNVYVPNLQTGKKMATPERRSPSKARTE